MFKGVKPRTHLMIDFFLFALLTTVFFSALMEHTAAGHARLMFHCLHGLAGTTMCFVVGVHLLVHFPWIRSQLSRLLEGRSEPLASGKERL